MDSVTDISPSSLTASTDVQICPLCAFWTPHTHPRFADDDLVVCDADADVIFISNDGVMFKIYTKYLAAASAGFAIPDFTSVGTQPVLLEEPAHTLEALFQFIHPPSEAQQFRQPSVINMEVNLFFSLAEAAEKYLVHGVMLTCITRME